MGIYVFEREVLFRLLLGNPELLDFGRDILPLAIETEPVYSHAFSGYWSDIGTIASFFDANLALTDPRPAFDLHDAERPLYTRPRMLPPTRIDGSTLSACLVTPGGHLEGCTVRRGILGVRSVVGRGAELTDCVVMGAERVESEPEAAEASERVRACGG
jgi:glucose-1-phosphate adenylyltransferase